MILTVTLNPAIDLYLELNGWVFGGELNRAQASRRLLGGKGINVSRAAHVLGSPTAALTVAGEDSSAVISALVQEEPFLVKAVPAPGETRENIHILNRENGDSLKVNQMGPPIGDALAAVRAAFDGQLTSARLAVLSGSLPPGTPTTIYRDLVRAAGEVPTVVDSEGSPLLDALEAKPFLVKPNRRELAATLKRKLPSQQDLSMAARELRARGARNVVITDGPHATYVLSEEDEFTVMPPAIKPVHTNGAGDSFTAGLASALLWGWTLPEAVRLGCAVGAVACLDLPTEEWSGQIERLVAQTQVTYITSRG